MSFFLKLLLFLAAGAAFCAAWQFGRHRRELMPAGVVLIFSCFLSGGFYLLCWACLDVLLLALLAVRSRKNKIRVNFTLPFLTILALVFFGALSCFWAADRGMAWFCLPQCCFLLLFAVLLSQTTVGERTSALELLPWIAAAGTVISFVLQFIPALKAVFTVNSRLAGFCEYPNTFALLCLCGLIVLLQQRQGGKERYAVALVLLFGILESGSRTTLALAIVFLIYSCVIRREARAIGCIILVAACAVGLNLLTDALGLTASGERISAAFTGSSTFYGRLIYFQDALGQILRHPFGQGYYGFYALQRSFQSAPYSTVYVHNALLQLLFDIGWVPALLLVLLLGKTLLNRSVPALNRVLLLAVCLHAMFDFDQAFAFVWVVLLLCLPWNTQSLLRGKPAAPGRVSLALGGVLCILSLWLGIGDSLYTAGFTAAALKLTPFHSLALTEKLTQDTDAAGMENDAEQLIALCPSSALGHSALANVYFSAGQVTQMLQEKDLALQNNRYSKDEYLDYLDKLFYCWSTYSSYGQTDDAEFCAEQIEKVVSTMQQVEADTNPLAARTVDVPDLALPDEYTLQVQAVLSGTGD